MDTSTAKRLHTINHNLRCHYGEINKLHAKETFTNIYMNGDKGTRLSNGVLTGLGLPVNNSDAVNKEYVHNVIQGLDLKESVVAASTENISNLNDIPSPLHIDGHEIKYGDRVLLKNQTNPSENGIYIYKKDQLVNIVNDKSNIEQKNENIELEVYMEEIKNVLPNSRCISVDLGSMKSSMELRTPFLNKDLVELLSTYNYRSLTSFGQKSILRHLLKRYVPDNLVDRPKQGFSFPNSWLIEQERYNNTINNTLPVNFRALLKKYDCGRNCMKMNTKFLILSEFLKQK